MYTRLLIVVLLFGACCTKKYCTFPIQSLDVKLVYKNYSPQELRDMTIYVTDQNYQVIDSTKNYSEDSTVTIFESMTFNSYPPATNNNYIAAIAGRRDTISSIKYDVVHEKIACNQCFPVGDGRTDATKFENFRFDYNGSTQYTDSVVIVK